MILIRNLKIKTQMLNSVVAVGNFDGVHKVSICIKIRFKNSKRKWKKNGCSNF